MKVVVLGVGAQGSIIAKRLGELPAVRELVCGDYNEAAAKRVAGALKKAKAIRVDAADLDRIVQVTGGASLIVNALPPDFNPKVMKAALQNRCCYQDLASGPVEDTDFISSVKRQLDMDGEFAAVGLSALFDTGSAPGLVSVLARNAADKLERVESILIAIYDGIWTKRFIPFWWSPETAFGDMAAEAVNFVNGKLEAVPPYNDPQIIDFRGLGPRRVVDHEHEEPVTFGLLSQRAFKGCGNVTFKYGGPAVDLSETLYKMGLLSREPVNVGGIEVIPLELVCKLTPPAPADPASIRQALSEGMAQEEGATLVRVEGSREGRKVRIDSYVNAPGLTEAFEKHGITHETFLTGQSAFAFSKLFVDGRITQKGVFPPELLDQETRNYYLADMRELGITVDEIVETRLY
jgi:saccharopine dehydrogenase-like NADP-dependent oxidoreductase